MRDENRLNNYPVHYARVATLTGMFASVDDELLESGRRRREQGSLPPRSALLLEEGEF